MTTKDCIFCKIVSGEIKSNLIAETKKAIAIHDINPVASTHILIIPKKHIDSVLTVSEEDSGDIIELYRVAKKIVEDKKLDAFRLTFNGGKYQHVPHLHMHLISGSKVEWSRL
ncbi:MAG: HIT domain-containing protein [Candidatus Curtissbacteria bacterium]|nr:HIT domain-containing protein [Candidatus Curtissbacteria bacterium]